MKCQQYVPPDSVSDTSLLRARQRLLRVHRYSARLQCCTEVPCCATVRVAVPALRMRRAVVRTTHGRAARAGKPMARLVTDAQCGIVQHAETLQRYIAAIAHRHCDGRYSYGPKLRYYRGTASLPTSSECIREHWSAGARTSTRAARPCARRPVAVALFATPRFHANPDPAAQEQLSANRADLVTANDLLP